VWRQRLFVLLIGVILIMGVAASPLSPPTAAVVWSGDAAFSRRKPGAARRTSRRKLGTEDVIYVLRASDLILWESGIRARVLPETKASNLTVLLQIYSIYQRDSLPGSCTPRRGGART
jgi:hypothetical protein